MTQSWFDFPSYSPSFGLSNGHVQSIVPSVFRQVEVPFQRSTLELDDGDFLLLDTLYQPDAHRPWVVLSHGLEGSSRRHYIQGMARSFFSAGWNVLAWNFRSCGGQLNRLPRFYHSGAYDDLIAVIRHLATAEQAERIFLVGFSMGGNQTVLTMADENMPDQVIGAATFSVPLDLASCAEKLARPAQKIYMKRFLRDLKEKVAAKAALFPDLVNMDGYDAMTSFYDFDGRYTAPLHGFNSAEDYWQRCSSGPVLPRLRRPTLIVNATNDPFLSEKCFDCRQEMRSPHLYLETPSHGGHVGFIRWKLNDELWSEKRAVAFAQYTLEKTV